MNVAHYLGLLISLVAGPGPGTGQILWEPPDALQSLDPLPKASFSRVFITSLAVADTNIVRG
jgi:hypothetical protein